MPDNATFETPQIWPDTPAEHSDSSFHFDAYAVTLARLIANKETGTPMTIDISGPWGSGKTSLVRQVRRLLQETEAKDEHFSFAPHEPKTGFRICRTIWFNARKYHQNEHILAGLLRAIIGEMAHGNIFHQFKAKVEKCTDKTDWSLAIWKTRIDLAETLSNEKNLRGIRPAPQAPFWPRSHRPFQ